MDDDNGLQARPSWLRRNWWKLLLFMFALSAMVRIMLEILAGVWNG